MIKYNYTHPTLAILIAGIGDLVLSSPALRALRNGHPSSPLHLLTSTEAAELAVNYPYIDKVWPFPIRQLRKGKKSYFEIIRVIKKMRCFQYQLAVNLYHVDSLSGALRMGSLFSLIRSDEKIGHDRYGMGLFLHRKLPKDFYADCHLADAMLSISHFAGGSTDNSAIELFWDRNLEGRWHNFFNEVLSSPTKETKKFLIGINPGGDRANRRWAPERYASVGSKIAAVMPARMLIFGGPGEEQIAAAVERQMTVAAVNLAGKLSLNELAYLISRLDLLITNDSGPMHMAAATRTPVAAIFGPEDPVLMRPYTSEDLYRVIYKPLPCRPCQKDLCERPLCLEAVTAEEVFSAAMKLLEGNSRP